jgi:hypothetical protein
MDTQYKIGDQITIGFSNGVRFADLCRAGFSPIEFVMFKSITLRKMLHGVAVS